MILKYLLIVALLSTFGPQLIGKFRYDLFYYYYNEPKKMWNNVVESIAVMSIDLGSEFMKIGIVKPGIPMEIVLNKFVLLFFC